MVRRSILSSVRQEQAAKPEPGPGLPPATAVAPEASETSAKPASAAKPSRRAKLHIGGYYHPDDPIIIAFQKLGIDLRKSQQDMLLDAIRDFVAKSEASRVFSHSTEQV